MTKGSDSPLAAVPPNPESLLQGLGGPGTWPLGWSQHTALSPGCAFESGTGRWQVAGGSWHDGQSGSEGGEGKEPLLARVQLGSPSCHLSR